MSRIGKKPIAIPAGVTIDINGNNVTVKGAKGTLSRTIDCPFLELKALGTELVVTTTKDDRDTNAKHGLYRTLLNNMVVGCSEGYKRSVIVYGVGYKAEVVGNKLVMGIGYSHKVEMVAPAGITFEVIQIKAPQGSRSTSPDNALEITISGHDKELVGQTAANIKAKRPVEPYQGYGIRFKEQDIILKEGKKSGK